jgi:hypothetical protein
MKAVFKYEQYRTHPKLNGIRFPSVETFIATKAVATTVRKRLRDAFDIFVSVADQEPTNFKRGWEHLMFDGLFRDANKTLWEVVHNGDALKKIGLVVDGLSPRARPSEEQIPLALDFLLEPTS